MLTEKEIIKKLYELPEVFKINFYEKRYAEAKHNYDTARKICVFLNVDIRHQIALFGSRSYMDDEEETDGLFPEKMVEKAYLECIRNNKTFENAGYPGKPRI